MPCARFYQKTGYGAQVGVSGRHLLRFAGTIQVDDFQIMKRAIEDGCERIDIDEW